MPLTLADFDFLTSQAGAQLLSEIAPYDLAGQNTLSLITQLRRRFTKQQVGAAVTMAKLRQKAHIKFGADAAQLFFTETALQQASGLLIRRYRAKRLASGLRVLDVCCGIGTDSLAFAQENATVRGLDIDPLRIAIARHNAQRLGLDCSFVVADVRDHIPSGYDMIFFDPARRDAQGRRIYDVEQYIPPLRIVRNWHVRLIVVKLSPGVDLQQLSTYGGSVEFISVNGDLKEALLILDDEDQAGSRATRLSGESIMHWQRQGDEPSVPCAEPQGWLCEPDPALIRAGLVRDAAASFGGTMLDETIAFFTSDSRIASPWVRQWRIQAWMPFQLKRLRSFLRARQVGTVTVKKRGSPIRPDELISKLKKLKGDVSCTLVLTRYRGQPIVIICDNLANQ